MGTIARGLPAIARRVGLILKTLWYPMHRQGRDATCPFCNSVIHLEVKYRLPWTVLSPEVRLCLNGWYTAIRTSLPR